MEDMAAEIKDLKRAYCQVMELTNAQLGALRGEVGSLVIPMWAIVALLTVSVWRHW
jgi:hypothetical protein